MKQHLLFLISAAFSLSSALGWVEPSRLPRSSNHAEGTRLCLSVEQMSQEPMGWVEYEGETYHLAPFDVLDQSMGLAQLCEALYQHNIRFETSRFFEKIHRQHTTPQPGINNIVVLENLLFLRHGTPMLLPLAILQFADENCCHIDTVGLTPLPRDARYTFTAKSNQYYHDYTFHELYRKETPQGVFWYNENRPDILYPAGQ